MSETIIHLWTNYGAGSATILTVASCGFVIVFHETRTQRIAAIHIANWMWDAARVEQFLAWRRVGLIAQRWRDEPDATSNSTLSAYDVSEADLLLFDLLELRYLQAKQIEAILYGQKCDKQLLKAEKEIEASIGRRRRRMSNHQPTPGLVRSSASFGLGHGVGSIDVEINVGAAGSALESISNQKPDLQPNWDAAFSEDHGAPAEKLVGDEAASDPYLQSFNSHLPTLLIRAPDDSGRNPGATSRSM